VRYLRTPRRSWYKVTASIKTLRYLNFDIPSNARYWEPEEDSWYVHTSQIIALTQVGYLYDDVIDIDQLDGELQRDIAIKAFRWKKKTVKKKKLGIGKTQAYSALYLLPTAPFAVVQTVFRSLVKIHHPDHGGDEEQFRKLQAAYEVISEGQDH